MKHGPCLLLCVLLGVSSTSAMACYTVYDPSDRVVYQASTPPVDMSRPLHETLPARYPGGHLVFDHETQCRSLSPGGHASATSPAPLLTNRRIAQAMNVPYTELVGEIVLVEPRFAKVRPGVTVVPSRTLGGPRKSSVITELHDPPMTIFQSDGAEVVSEPGR